MKQNNECEEKFLRLENGRQKAFNNHMFNRRRIDHVRNIDVLIIIIGGFLEPRAEKQFSPNLERGKNPKISQKSFFPFLP